MPLNQLSTKNSRISHGKRLEGVFIFVPAKGEMFPVDLVTF